MKKSSIAAIALALAIMPSISMAGKVIVNAAGPASMTEEQVMAIYMGRETKLGASNASPVVQKDGVAKSVFHTKIIKRDPSQFESHWAKLTFTGRGKPPTVRASDADVVKFVESTPGAIGYVNDDANVGSAKVVLDF